MTPLQRQQLELLFREQRRLAGAVEDLDVRLRGFIASVKEEDEAEPAPAIVPQPAATVLRAPVPPLPQPATVAATAPPPLLLEKLRTAPEVAADSPGGEAPAPERSGAPTPPPVPQRSMPEREPPLGSEKQSLEMTLGTVWLARIGIVILLTGLVFLGNYAYLHIVHRLGPAGKLSLLYAAAGLLAGAGVWLERRKMTAGRYPQVLMAGGAATAYYTTYAAHFVERLRVIESPLLGGLLLLLVEGFFIWWSDRRKFQTAALLGLVLSYYTAAINPVGSYTIYANVLLTAAAGVLLVRNGWAVVSWVSLLGTYGSYLYWLFVATGHADRVEPLGPVESVNVPALWVLGSYWALFTSSVFLAPGRVLEATVRTTFLTLNNALFFALASYVYASLRLPHYWAFVLSSGVVLLGLAAVARLRRRDDLALDGAYLVQGLAAVTAGLAMKLTGPSLAIALAVESAVLLTAIRQRHGAIYRIGAMTVAWWAFCLALERMNAAPELILPLGGTVAAALLFDAWWLKQRSAWLAAMSWSWRAAAFAGPALVLVYLILSQKVHAPWEAPSLALAALVSTASIYLLRLPEVTLLGQSFLLCAVGTHLMDPERAPWRIPLLIIVVAVALAHWWQRQRILVRVQFDVLHFGCALAFAAVAYQWLGRIENPQIGVVMTVGLALATLLYGLLTRAWAISVVGQVFTLVGAWVVMRHFGPLHLPWFIALLPLAGVLATRAVLSHGAAERCPPELRSNLPAVSGLYWALSVVLLILWSFEYIPAEWRLLFLATVGAGLVLAVSRWPSQVRLYTGLGFFALAFALFWLGRPAEWPDVIAFLLAPATLRLARRHHPALAAERISQIVVGLTTATVWLWVTRWMYRTGNHELLTLAWSGLAVVVFLAGLTLRERVYRIGGFLILALAVGRIFAVDVWRLETIYRILSFLTLGVVLLALGFVYNRYAETIRRWL